jgi:hypothetical protein
MLSEPCLLGNEVHLTRSAGAEARHAPGEVDAARLSSTVGRNPAGGYGARIESAEIRDLVPDPAFGKDAMRLVGIAQPERWHA